MCGIFAVFPKSHENLSSKDLEKFSRIAKQSQRRGSDASGLLLVDRHYVRTIKFNDGIVQLLRKHKSKIFSSREKYSLVAGHTRLSTHGGTTNQFNNQPAISDNWVVLHNGIVCNHEEIKFRYNAINNELDTYAINCILENFPNSIEANISELQGEITFLAQSKHGQFVAYTNVGNLYLGEFKEVYFLASEQIFLERIGVSNITKLPKSIIVNYREKTGNFEFRNDTLQVKDKNVSDTNYKVSETDIPIGIEEKISAYLYKKYNALDRCESCLLPTNFPEISFRDGQCSLCNEWVQPELNTSREILSIVDGKQSGEKPKILVNLSGGRDSTYVLSELAKSNHFEITAFTYDWGFISNAARENMASVCGRYGLEHVVVSPNIEKNRLIVRKVLETWFKNPNLGTIPLLMSGDKTFHTWSMKIAKERNITNIVHSDHYLETTGFKSALAGAKLSQPRNGKVEFRLGLLSLLRMAFEYTKFIFLIPSYRFVIFKQTVISFLAYYVKPHRFTHFFDYYEWDEFKIEESLREIGWRKNTYQEPSWRMGDMTASLYNLLYLLNLGFTEHDAMLSNQIRAKKITRSEAIAKLALLNKPNLNGIYAYLNIIDLSPKLLEDYIETLL